MIAAPGFAFEVGSEFEVVRDLRGLAAAGGLLYAFTPPDTMLRIDPDRQTTEAVELGIGPSVGGAPSWVVTDDNMWLIGGAFRDQLIELDTTTMTEVRHVDTFGVAPGPGWVDADRTAVWVSHPPIASVSKLDPLTGRPSR